ncbi:MAG: ATP-binding protein [Christensenellaceae bacterium]
MKDYVFGASILENLTTGMYQDSKVIYREYIQNSCDQIDKAIALGITAEDDAKIEIWLNESERSIVIEDNATGIKAADFEKTLGNIADSDKKIGEDKGFRGIGRLCGLAYCSKLVFETSTKGEDTISILTCDAQKMRRMIEESDHGTKRSANEILDEINRFQTIQTADIDSHYFKVELIKINQENTDLLNSHAIRDYLAFVVPVEYQNAFIFRKKVYGHAFDLGLKIDEYNIRLEGEQVLKKYVTDLKNSQNVKWDEIFEIEFKDFFDHEGNLIAWMWFGLTQFNGIIPNSKSNPSNPMRGIRLRKENIQIGGEDALQKLFKEDRGNSYFVGEVFAVSKALIPNSQRDYFNENGTRLLFEKQLKQFFCEHLDKVYRTSSQINSAYKKIDAFEKKAAEYKELSSTGSFVNEEQRGRVEVELKQAEEAAKKAQASITGIKKKNSPDDLIGRVIERIERSHDPLGIADEQAPPKPDDKKNNKTQWRTDGGKYSAFSKNERKLISRILGIITANTDKETSSHIIKKIEEDLQ